MTRFTQLRHRLLAVGVAGALAASVVVSLPALPASAATTATVPAGAVALVPPNIPGVAPLPGPVAKVAQPSPTMGILSVVPDQGVVGTPMTISGTGLRPSTTVRFVLVRQRRRARAKWREFRRSAGARRHGDRACDRGPPR